MAKRLRYTVTYLDGREVEVYAGPAAQVATERYLKGLDESRQLEGAYYMAWAALHKSGKEPAPFDEWLELIEDAEVADETPDDADPTRTAPPLGNSSD